MSGRVLITGAACGLGRALARAFVDDGWRVLLTDVDTDAGERVRASLLAASGRGGEDIAFLALDVRDEAAWRSARSWCRGHWGGLDVLVNNAGVAWAGRVEEIPAEDWTWILEVNLTGALRGVRTFVPLFREQGHGHVVNIASMAGLLHGPLMAAYNVTKAGLVSLSETMRHELAREGVRTTVVCPMFFRTGLADRMRVTDPALQVIARQALAGRAVPGVRLERTPDQVAAKVVASVRRGRFWVLPHVEGRLAWALKRHTPRVFAAGMSLVGRVADARMRRRPPGRGHDAVASRR